MYAPNVIMLKSQIPSQNELEYFFLWIKLAYFILAEYVEKDVIIGLIQNK